MARGRPFWGIVLLLVAACGGEPSSTATALVARLPAPGDPLLYQAIAGATDDGAAERDLSEAAVRESGYRLLDALAARRAVAGNTLVTRWRSGRIVQAQYHRPSGLRLDSLRFEQLGFANGVTTAWYVEPDGDYCETDASRRNCGPLYSDGTTLIWMNRQEPSGPFGTRFAVLPGNHVSAGEGPAGPLAPAPLVSIGVGGAAREGIADIFRLRVRNQPEQIAAAHEVPHPLLADLRCVALRHPTREPELHCPDGFGAIGRSPAGWPTTRQSAAMATPDGRAVTLAITAIDPAIIPANMPYSDLETDR